jgi:Brp/Blh family beta-carotene 15,15'-monooxygenase
MTLKRPAQTGIFLGGLLVIFAMHALLALDLRAQLLVLAPAVALLGLPHGALDLPVAGTLWPLSRVSGRLRFAAAYLGLAGAVSIAWWLAPGPALAAFLAYAAMHFAGDWEGDGRLARVAGGVAAIGAPALARPGEVSALFAMLGPAEAAEPIALALAFAGAVAGGLALLAFFGAPLRRSPAAAEQGGIWLGAILLPPLLYFVAYFCLLHSLRHFVETIAALPDRARALREAGLVTAVTLAGAVFAVVALRQSDGAGADAALLKVVFIGLAALTVPHMLLVERFRRRRPVASKAPE